LVFSSEFGSLSKVDALTGASTKIDLGGESVPSGAGLVLAGTTHYVVQNFLNQICVVTLDASFTSAVVSDEPITSPDYQISTTAAKFGNTLYAVNAHFGEFTLGVPSLDLEFTVVGLPAR
jgi:hypothetical protein